MLTVAERMIGVSVEEQKVLFEELKARHKEQVTMPVEDVKDLLFDIISCECNNSECVALREKAYKLGRGMFKRNHSGDDRPEYQGII